MYRESRVKKSTMTAFMLVCSQPHNSHITTVQQSQILCLWTWTWYTHAFCLLNVFKLPCFFFSWATTCCQNWKQKTKTKRQKPSLRSWLLFHNRFSKFRKQDPNHKNPLWSKQNHFCNLYQTKKKPNMAWPRNQKPWTAS